MLDVIPNAFDGRGDSRGCRIEGGTGSSDEAGAAGAVALTTRVWVTSPRRNVFGIDQNGLASPALSVELGLARIVESVALRVSYRS